MSKRKPKSLYQTLIALPVFDDPYLQVQAHNLEIVDGILTQMENEVLREYFDSESTPASAFVLAALSQLWIFGLYEILRTWRQRILRVMNFGEELRKLSDDRRSQRLSKKERELSRPGEFLSGVESVHFRSFQRVTSEPKFLESVQTAKYRVESFFQRLEALRISLAKHEKASGKGSVAVAPGSGRLDMRTGSIQWFVSLDNNEVDMVSRREIADNCREFSLNREISIRPKQFRKILGRFSQVSYGTWCIRVKLDDGSVYSGVIVKWAQEITNVKGYPKIPFKPNNIVEVMDDSISLKKLKERFSARERDF